MQRNTKEWIQYGSAIAVLLLAIILVYISYFTSQARDVTDNVLWYFAQSLMYAGSIFGVAIAIDANGKPIDSRTPEQKDALVLLLHKLKQQFPSAQIMGHRDIWGKDKSKWKKMCEQRCSASTTRVRLQLIFGLVSSMYSTPTGVLSRRL